VLVLILAMAELNLKLRLSLCGALLCVVRSSTPLGLAVAASLPHCRVSPPWTSASAPNCESTISVGVE
jgi:hypothetical protein